MGVVVEIARWYRCEFKGRRSSSSTRPPLYCQHFDRAKAADAAAIAFGGPVYIYEISAPPANRRTAHRIADTEFFFDANW